MTSLNAGLVISRGTARHLVDRVVQAEQRGVGTVWTTVGGPTADPVTAYAAAAALTDRVVLGTAVTPTYPRHPITLASQAIAINDLAPGRFRLGIGTSHKPTIEGSYGIPMGKPHAHLREYLTILRGLLWDGASEFAGEYFTVNASLPETVAPPKLPILVSALRQNAFELAGELSDGAITWVTPVHHIVNTGIPALQAGADRAGRERPPVVAHVPVAFSTDRDAAREAFRAQFPVYPKLPFYAAMFAAAGLPATADGLWTEELIDSLLVFGTPAEIRTRLEDIRAQGIEELLISQVVVVDEASELEGLSQLIAE